MGKRSKNKLVDYKIHDECDLSNEAGTTVHGKIQHDECDLTDEAGTIDHAKPFGHEYGM